ncbi:MAG: DUF1294 domain-containing protein [Evtepia sp.]|uniref:DUF1294 domain-containing protein n=1 Tax=Evtepia sp. TaxID=2773933 RepID=UPI002A748E52|nr:DUF1294 domain-containing protein [Evtepia sp.]MDY3013740.1 DUF1294 domain-containing protein [Evtepia sp.]
MILLLIWLVVWNLIAFALMGIDKWKAAHDKWRIPERTLFLSALLGGSIGAILGMSMFHHKTRHWTFKLGMPAILVLQIAAALGVSYWHTFIR